MYVIKAVLLANSMPSHASPSGRKLSYSSKVKFEKMSCREREKSLISRTLLFLDNVLWRKYYRHSLFTFPQISLNPIAIFQSQSRPSFFTTGAVYLNMNYQKRSNFEIGPASLLIIQKTFSELILHFFLNKNTNQH